MKRNDERGAMPFAVIAVAILLGSMMCMAVATQYGNASENTENAEKDADAIDIALTNARNHVNRGLGEIIRDISLSGGTGGLSEKTATFDDRVSDWMSFQFPLEDDGTIMELGNKNVDISLAGYSPDPERADLMDFSDVYITGGQSFVCTQANKDQFADLAAANNPDYSIGAQIGSIQADLAKEHTPDADIVELSKVTDIIAEVIGGKLDGAFIETVVAETYAKNYPELCVVLPVPYEAEGSVVGVKKDNAALLAAVNLAIEAALEDGSMSQFVADANAAASGNTFEGLLTEEGEVPTE
jgi:polar amino acid transport system substrate-binding protein